jgi:hypothetical protein
MVSMARGCGFGSGDERRSEDDAVDGGKLWRLRELDVETGECSEL